MNGDMSRLWQAAQAGRGGREVLPRPRDGTGWATGVEEISWNSVPCQEDELQFGLSNLANRSEKEGRVLCTAGLPPRTRAPWPPVRSGPGSVLTEQQAVLTAGQLTVSVSDTPSVHHSDQVCLRLAGTTAGSVSDNTHMLTRIPGKGRKHS